MPLVDREVSFDRGRKDYGERMMQAAIVVDLVMAFS